MTEWMYRATPTKVTLEETRDLALSEGFICRSAFEDNGSKADNTQHVHFRDVIHVYFTGDGQAQAIGSFEVVGPNRHPQPGRFGAAVKGTTLMEVIDVTFASRLAASATAGGEGYAPDPVLKKFTGWPVLHRADVATPPFDPSVFPNQATLVRRK